MTSILQNRIHLVITALICLICFLVFHSIRPTTSCAETPIYTIRADVVTGGYAIIASAGANGSISPSSSQNVLVGANQIFIITPETGYHVANVLVDGNSVGAVMSYTFSSVQANHTITASFAANPTYTLISSAGANGTISPSGGVSVLGGANQRFTITPASEFRVANVLVDGVSVGSSSIYNFTNVQASHTISATFAPDTFTLVASVIGSGTITHAGVTTVNRGGSQTYTITPDSGWQVKYVVVDSVDKGAVASYTFSNVTTNHTIKVYFKMITYAINASAGANGSISPNGSHLVPIGTDETVSITPDAGYRVADVMVDGSSVRAVTSYAFTNVQAAHTITATFVENAWFIIDARAGPNGTISPSGRGSLQGGTNQRFTITPASGYRVANILVDGASVSAVTTYNFFNIQEPHSISATFVSKP